MHGLKNVTFYSLLTAFDLKTKSGNFLNRLLFVSLVLPGRACIQHYIEFKLHMSNLALTIALILDTK